VRRPVRPANGDRNHWASIARTCVAWRCPEGTWRSLGLCRAHGVWSRRSMGIDRSPRGRRRSARGTPRNPMSVRVADNLPISTNVVADPTRRANHLRDFDFAELSGSNKQVCEACAERLIPPAFSRRPFLSRWCAKNISLRLFGK